MSDKPVIMVTGAAGLIGRAVCRHLAARGTPILAVDRIAGRADPCAIEICDVTDIHRLHALAQRFEIGGIIHCGAFSGPMVERDNPHAIAQVNIGGTANVLELARIHKVRRFVFCSSASAYGATPQASSGEAH
ncbi:MAG TPA: NAD-dependent dehydratase, partial [Gammaproteobacteria bacterium]|nr:NAD-dependent dehydratase [Gammaproteobacteria bacterium]